MSRINLFRPCIVICFLLVLTVSCKKDDSSPVPEEEGKQLTIFLFNDPHGQLDNFAKIKHIVDAEKEKTNVLLVCGGDIFSGNPIVDQYNKKGYPMVDVMNRTGVDIAVLGNHEFDYGVPILSNRYAEAEFDWVCANVNTNGSELPQPDPYKTLTLGDLKITVLGLVETNGKEGEVIPSTHPWRVMDLEFQPYMDVTGQYQNLKTSENADVYMALTHLGEYTDKELANDFPYFDLIVGGHSHTFVNEKVNGIPIFQAGSYLSHLGKIELTVEDGEVEVIATDLIDLNEYTEVDEELKGIIDAYNDAPEFEEVVGYATSYLNTTELGCFYTTALKEYMGVDASFQNGGGIRAGIDEGDITAMEIYRMDPFNNGSVVFTMTVAEIKDFFENTGAHMHISGISLENSGSGIIIYNESGDEMGDNETVTIGINDYIPAVHDSYFNYSGADIKELTTAETIIQYLKTVNSTVGYEGCDRYY